ncbi:MAG: (2Fe-2S)-binding protein [Nitriliruptoraceae bacterium]|nr:(2Fe-2S)-binding protein [Nitriliruptoraceae bacterium]
MTSKDHRIAVTLNGAETELDAAPYETLLEVLRREQLHGCRESCGQGVCGTCTVLVGERTIASCIMLAHLADGERIETVEGMGTPGDLSVVQQAFVEHAGFQCGFCTPGMIVTVTQLLRENPSPTDDEVDHYLAGNICRCGAYPEIRMAVRTAAARLRGEDV